MSPDRPEAVGGVDVGGTGVRVRVVLGDRSAERRHAAVLPRLGGRVDVPVLGARVRDELDAAMAELDVSALTGLGVGMTGIPGLVDDSQEVDHHLRAGLEVGVCVVAGDAVTTHLGALAGAAGTVVAAGTGVIALATDLDRTWQQIDGWGILLGDEGSGAWVGRRGLQAALRSIDGRAGGSADLAARLREEFGSPLDLVGRIYPSGSPAYELASFAPAVASAARAGDPVAAEIWREAGRVLARAAVAGARSLPPVISWGGGLFQVGDLVVEPFRAAVRAAWPEADLRAPAGTALDGAVLLARRAGDGLVSSRPPHLEVFPARKR